MGRAIVRSQLRALGVGRALCTSAVSGQAPSDADEKALQAEARSLVQQFAGQLKPTLQKAMAEGGPTQAIQVCSKQAPAIAQQLSRESGWDVTRVSLKPRNQQTASPDAWEREQLKEFDRRQAAGEPAAQINTARQVDNTFRYMQAQGVEPLCLSCHGEKLSPAVEQALQRHYPADIATGYSLGQVRGAISLKKLRAE